MAEAYPHLWRHHREDKRARPILGQISLIALAIEGYR